jgi:hypothetical protein
VRSTRARFERGVTLGAVAGEKLGDPTLRHVILAGDVDGTAALDDNGSDNQTGK